MIQYTSTKQIVLTAHRVKIEYNEFSGKNDKFKDFYEQAFDGIRKGFVVNSE